MATLFPLTGPLNVALCCYS